MMSPGHHAQVLLTAGCATETGHMDTGWRCDAYHFDGDGGQCIVCICRAHVRPEDWEAHRVVFSPHRRVEALRFPKLRAAFGGTVDYGAISQDLTNE